MHSRTSREPNHGLTIAVLLLAVAGLAFTLFYDDRDDPLLTLVAERAADAASVAVAAGPAGAELPPVDAAAVGRAQLALRALGYGGEDVEGIAGAATQIAVRAFQADHRLAETGHVDLTLIQRLEHELNRRREAGTVPYGRGLLWRVARDGVRPSYLFGTIHYSDPRVLSLPQEVAQAFANADIVALEVADFQGLEANAARAMVMNDGRSLEEIAGQPLFDAVAAALAKRGFGAQQIRAVKPWAIYIFLTLPNAELQRAARGIPYLDQWLEEQARTRGKRVAGLETMAEQLSVMNEMPEAIQLALMQSAVAYADRTDELQEMLIDLYLKRDLAGIQREMSAPAQAADAEVMRVFLDRLINRRNLRMARAMADLLAAGNAFVAVGALHLPGDPGILRLLERRGYKIEAVY